jgi:hypothetical protein
MLPSRVGVAYDKAAIYFQLYFFICSPLMALLASILPARTPEKWMIFGGRLFPRRNHTNHQSRFVSSAQEKSTPSITSSPFPPSINATV